MSVPSGATRQVLEARLRTRRVPGRKGVPLEDEAGVRIDQRDVVLPREGDLAVRHDVQVDGGKPIARGVRVIEVGAPDLLAGGRVGLGDKRARGHQPLERGIGAAPDVELAGLAVVDVGRGLVVVGAPPGVYLIGTVEGAGERRAREDAAALAVGDFRTVERRVVAGRRQRLAAGQLLLVETEVAGQRAVRRDLVRGQADPVDALLDLRLNDRPQQAVGGNRKQSN